MALSNYEMIKQYARRMWHPLADDFDAIGNNYTLGSETGTDTGDPLNNNTLTSTVTDARGIVWNVTYTPPATPNQGPLVTQVSITLTTGGSSATDETLLQDPIPDTAQVQGD